MGVAKYSGCGYKMAMSKSKPCGVCGLVFSHSSSLSRHVKDKHSGKESGSIGCTKCDCR